MRNSNRIPDILNLLQQGWEKVPDWRLGQLIENLKRYIGVDDLFYIEDNKIIEKLLISLVWRKVLMTNYEHIKSMSIDKFSEWIDKYGQFDSSPWMLWFDHKYCKNCQDIMCHYEDSKYEFPCSWCELEGKCKYFLYLDEAPDNKMIIKMWLESEVK